ncbi:ABC transporter permease [Claveliimonas bilis]|uniref:ABC transporter permease n=1 Tax=Claveliimonas bilis TaxID=3028070 RepID=UPI00293152F4|nr:ABC transporter permease [Claveliimonas bilis]BDZ81199.1 ABC transporter permease [Claveliimonas bilis]
MLKVNNKKVINDLAKTTYSAHKKRNILTILAIFLTTFLICTIISIGISYWDTVALRQQRMQGMDYDIELTEPRDDQVSAIRKMENVKYAGLSVKCAVLSKYEDKELDKIRLFWLDNTCWEKQTIPALDYYKGEYPQKENEIMLSKTALNSMGIENPDVGMELPLVYQTLSENSDSGEITKTFILSGWFLDYSSGTDKGYVSKDFYRTTGVLQTDFTQGELKISLKNPLYSERDITEMQNQINISGKQIIEADYDTISNFCKTIIGLCVLLLLIFMSGYLFIYNTLYISVNKDIRYYGQLKTIGTTSIQIRRMINKQVLWNTVIGIPLGLICSAVVGKIVIPQLLHAINPSIMPNDVEAVSVWVFIIATVFSFATTVISSQKPAKIAMNCSPVEAIKYIGASSSNRKSKIRNGGDIRSMVRINLFRDKKQFGVIMCSLSLALSLFLIINTVIYANNATNILNHSYDYDLMILNQTLLSDNEEQVITNDLIENVKNLNGVKDVRTLESTTATVPYQEDVYGEYYKELYQSRYAPGNYDKDINMYKQQADYDNNMFSCRIVGIDDLEFEQLNQELETPLDKEAFDNGEIAFASKIFTEGDNGMIGKKVSFFVPNSDDLSKKETIEIGALTDFPAYYSAGYSPDLIVSDDYFEKIVQQPLIEMIKIDYKEAFSKSTEDSIMNLIKDSKVLSVDSKLSQYSDMKNSENQITVFGGSIGLIVMLLAISNYLNMMSVSMQNRSKEFAILESVGMTRKQIKKMVVFESLCYTILSIAIAMIIGLPASYFVFENLNIYVIPFAFPMIKNLILFLVIITICVVSTLLILRKTKNESIIELLRQDEM